MGSEPRKDQTLSAFATRTLGRYELLTQIGKGGMAEVHLAMQRGPGGFEKLVVIKLIHEHFASHPAFIEMLLDEGRLAGMIKHPNVIDIYDLGEADDRHYVAMEYLDGEPLLSILRHGVEGERLDPLSTARVIADTAEGLDAAHRLKSLDGKPLGLIHHDVSLGNIVVLYNGQVKLVDFGVAKAAQSGKSDLVQGKFGYMAPEKLNDGAVDKRSDIWSLGVVAWEALTLQRLFKAKTDADTMKMVLELEIPPPSKAASDVPPEFDAIVMRALERDPEKRMATAKQFAVDLESVLRKRAYAGKNDRIAAYMERSFAEQIKVREKLVAELSAGRTSKATIAAFTKVTTNTRQQPVTPVPGVPGVVMPEVSDGIPSHPDLRAAAFLPNSRPGTVVPDESPSAAARRESIRDLQEWVDDERRWRALPWWQRYAPFLAGGAVLLTLVLVVVKCNGSSDEVAVKIELDAAMQLAKTEPPVDAAVVVVEPDAPAPDAPVIVEPDAAVDVTVDPDHHDEPKPDKPVKPVKPDKPIVKAGSGSAAAPDPKTAEGLTKVGFEQIRKGDTKTAIDTLNRALKVNQNYAPAWYGLGRAYEQSGMRKGPIKSAYLRYLSIAPSGQYSADARARLQKL